MSYTEGDNVSLDQESYNGMYVCFWSEDAGGNVGRAVSAQISGVDKTAPSVTVGSVTGTGTKTVSATDDDGGTTVMKYKIQSSGTCSASVPDDAADYTESDNVSLDNENYNGMYVCFWSEDAGGNVGLAVSAQISGIDTVGPVVTVSSITGTGTRNVSATDDDAGSTTMKYKIQSGSSCSASVPGDALSYTEGDNVSLNQESYNGQYVCFWSTDSGNNVGKGISARISGIDLTAPSVTVGSITGVGTKNVSATDDDSASTVMKYKIQSSGSCSASVPSDAVSYTEGDNVSLNQESYNGKYVCFWSTDAANNTGKNVSAQISGVDKTAPSVTVGSITGTGTKTVSATDDDSASTSMNYKIQSSGTCSASVPDDAADYTEGDDVSLDNENYNGKYVCFWSTDQGGNTGKAVSAQISGIDTVGPVVTVSSITGTGTKNVSATDDDAGTTTMKYKIQSGSSCSASVPGDAVSYTEGDNVSLNQESYNGQYVCFWSTDSGNNVGKGISARISGIDLTAPSVTVGSITGVGTKNVSATDDDSGTTVMKYKIQSSGTCPASVPEDASSYNEGDNVSLNQESYNGKYVCFWSTDAANNTGKNVSAQISGVDKTAPAVTVSGITGTRTRNVSASDDDSGTTVMKYKIQSGSACSASVPGDAESYTEGANVSLDDESYNGMYVCFWSTDSGNNTGKNVSARISGIDLTAPVVTASQITGKGTRVVSASDDDSGTTVMKHKMQSNSTCPATVPGDAESYTEGANVILDNESYNGMYVCFWSTDLSSNTGMNVSARISGVDKTAPSMSIDWGSGTDLLGGKTVSASDNDNGETTMSYKIQSNSTCSAAVPRDATNYTEGSNVTLDREVYNSMYVCFWSVDLGGNVGVLRSEQISGIDVTKPVVTVSAITGAGVRKVSATDTDNGGEATVMEYKIQSNSTCSATVPGDAESYTEGENVNLDNESYNGMYVCFWSTDNRGNVGNNASGVISGVDRTAPVVTVSAITGVGVKKVSATDTDNGGGETVMKYRIQPGSACPASVPGNASELH